MTNAFFKLVYTKSKKKTDHPFTPFAYIELKSYSQETDGSILIGEKCISYKELDDHIQWLEKELENIRRYAKTKFEI